jgi:hypothetical protein
VRLADWVKVTVWVAVTGALTSVEVTLAVLVRVPASTSA